MDSVTESMKRAFEGFGAPIGHNSPQKRIVEGTTRFSRRFTESFIGLAPARRFVSARRKAPANERPLPPSFTQYFT